MSDASANKSYLPPTWRFAQAGAHGPLLHDCEQLLADCLRFHEGTWRDCNSPATLVESALFARCSEVFAGIITTSCAGVGPAYRALGRVLLEAYVQLVAILSDDRHLQDYLAQFPLKRKAIINALANSTDTALSDLRSAIPSSVLDELSAIEGKPSRFEQLARSVGLESMYATGYRFLSGAVHSDAMDLEANIAYSQAGEIVRISCGPTDNELAKTVALSAMLLVDLLKRLTARQDPELHAQCDVYLEAFSAHLPEVGEPNRDTHNSPSRPKRGTHNSQ